MTRRMPRWVAGVIGLVALILAWWVFSLTAFTPAEGTTYTPVPTPVAVVDWMLFQGNIGTLWTVFQPTLAAAGIGYLWGNGLALVLAALVLLLPRLEGLITQVAVVTYCLPIVAIGGISIAVLGGAKRPGDPSSTAIFLAALSIFFTTVVGTLLGFRSADRASLDLVRVYGGSAWDQLVKVRLIAALPAILNALQIAVPSAFLGAVLGEYMGGTDRSVGAILIMYQGNLNSTAVWAVFLLSALVAFAGYALVGLLSRIVTPWVSGGTGERS